MANDIAPAENVLAPAEIDWHSSARSAIRQSDTKGTSKLTTRLLGELCKQLADGIPMKTATRALGTAPQTIHDWISTRPPIARLIEEAKASGEIGYINAIKQDRGFKAQAYMLERFNAEYAENNVAGPRAGISISINVPIPGNFTAGETPMIDITPRDETAEE